MTVPSFPFGPKIAELAGREVDSPLPQLLQQQRLRQVALVVLIQNGGDQRPTEMTAEYDFANWVLPSGN